MDRFARFIVSHKKRIIVLYVVLVLISLILARQVSVEYDLSAYIPKNMDSIVGRDMLNEEFGISGTATLLLENRELYEVQGIKENIEKLPEVKNVIWLDDVEDIKKPREFFDENISKNFTKGNYNLIQIQFYEGDESLETKRALDKIDNMLEDGEYYLGGQAAVARDTQDTASREMTYYSIVAFIIIAIILFISSEYYLEPLLFFISIGVAIAINMGTNILFGKVSFMTHSVAGILQLAVSMDYSIFLLHRFREELETHDPDEAMVQAIEMTFSSISASAVTTIFGFLALVPMKYGIGRDMGLVLAKGVLLSLISVVTLLPCLVLITYEKFKYYRHRALMPNFEKVAKGLISLRVPVLIIALLIALPAFLAQSNVDYYYSSEKTLSRNSDAVVANTKIAEVFGHKNELILMVSKSDNTKIRNMIEKIDEIENVDEVQSLYSMVDPTLPKEFIPDNVLDQFESDRYTYMIINLNTEPEGEEVEEAIGNIKEKVSSYFDEWYLTGESAVYGDLKEVTSKDFNKVTIISISLIALTLFATFKSLTIPIILVFVIQLGIWINLSIPYFLGSELNFIAFIVIGAIQLGATVDYAILLTSRYRENLEAMTPHRAMERAIAQTAPSVLTSALILMAGTFSVSLITTIRSASELTMLIGRGAIISLLLVYMLLPALLLFSKPIEKTTIGWPKSTE